MTMQGTCEQLLEAQHNGSESRQEGEQVLCLDILRPGQAYAALAFVPANCYHLQRANCVCKRDKSINI